MLQRVTRRNRRGETRARIVHACFMPFPIAKQRGGIIAAACVLASAICMPSNARAAGAAYAVDTSEISAEGSCKVETWYSWASNTDLIGIANPSCVVNVGRPVEFSAQLSRSRFDDEWNTIVGPKAKTKIIPSAIGSFGLAISGQAFYDLTTAKTSRSWSTFRPPCGSRTSCGSTSTAAGSGTASSIVITSTYGLGVDWRTPDNVWTLTAEVFGQVGAEQEISTITQPRFQTGLRWRPIDVFSIDFVYGRNIYGENANWFTVATTMRFPPPGGKGGGE